MRETLTWLTRAKAAYDAVYTIKPFPTQLAPRLPHLDPPNESDAGAEESDAIAVAKRLGALIDQQRELQGKLRQVQQGMHRATRNLQYELRCHDLQLLIDTRFGPRNAASADDAPHAAPVRVDAGACAGAGDEVGGRSRQEADGTAEVLEGWIARALEQLHEHCLKQTGRKVEHALNRMQTASEEQRHFSEQLSGLSGKGKGGVGLGGGGRGKGKEGNALLDSQYAEFYRDALQGIACELASYHQTCSSLKRYLSQSAKRSGGEGRGGV